MRAHWCGDKGLQTGCPSGTCAPWYHRFELWKVRILSCSSSMQQARVTAYAACSAVEGWHSLAFVSAHNVAPIITLEHVGCYLTSVSMCCSASGHMDQAAICLEAGHCAHQEREGSATTSADHADRQHVLSRHVMSGCFWPCSPKRSFAAVQYSQKQPGLVAGM